MKKIYIKPTLNTYPVHLKSGFLEGSVYNEMGTVQLTRLQTHIILDDDDDDDDSDF